MTNDEKLAALIDLASDLATGKSKQSPIATVLDEVQRAVGDETGIFYLIDRAGNQFHARPPTADSQVRESGVIRLGRDVSRTVVELTEAAEPASQLTVVAANLNKCESSLLVAPLVAAGKSWGVLCALVDKTRAEALGKPTREYIRALANIAALVMRFFSEKRYGELLLSSLSEAVSPPRIRSKGIPARTTDETELFEVVAERALRMSGADLVILYEYFQDIEDVGIPPIVKGDLNDLLVLEDRGVAIPHKESVLFRLLERRGPFFAEDAIVDWVEAGFPLTAAQKAFLGREGIRSSAGVPLTIGKEVVGVLFVNYRRSVAFSPSLRDQVQIFADNAALAISQARYQRMLKRQVSALESLYEVSIKAEGAGGPAAALELLLRRVVKLTGADAGFVFVVEDREQVDSIELTTWLGAKPKKRTGVLSFGKGVAGRVAADEKARIVNDYQDWERKNPDCIFEDGGFASMAAVPIVSGTGLVGVLEVASRETVDGFNSHDLSLLKRFAVPAAIAIGGSRLRSHQRALLECSPMGVIAINTRGRITEFSRSASAFLGYQRNVKGRHVSELYWDGRGEAVRIRALLEDRGSVAHEESFVRDESGERVPIYLSASILKNEDGKILGSVGFMEDLRFKALRGRAKRLFRVIEEFNRVDGLSDFVDLLLLESAALAEADDAAVFLYREGSLECSGSLVEEAGSEASQRLCRQIESESPVALGVDADRWNALSQGVEVASVIPLASPARKVGYLYLESRQRKYFRVEEEIFKTLGRHAALIVTRFHLLEDRDRTREGLLSSANAVAAAHLTMGLAHDIGNGLNNISLAVASSVSLLGGVAGPAAESKSIARIRASLGKVEAEIDRLEDLIVPLRNKQGLRFAPRKRPAFVNDVVVSALDLLSVTLSDKKLKLTKEFDPSLGRPRAAGTGNPVDLDERQIHHVLVNILLNAIHSTSARGKLTVQTRNHGDKVEVTVSDTGCGMSDEAKARIFEPGYTTKGDEGSGLGLFISQVIVRENHRGHIEVRTGIGKGSVFSIFLPRNHASEGD